MRRILSRCFDLGARAAEPGEFALRAYLNGKMDLAQADAVADIVNAESAAAARAAARSLTGVFSREIRSASDSLEAARAGVEAAMDFADEELDENNFAGPALTEAIGRLERLLARAGQGAILTEGAAAAIVGPPNAGKSSLLNCLAEEDAGDCFAGAGDDARRGFARGLRWGGAAAFGGHRRAAGGGGGG